VTEESYDEMKRRELREDELRQKAFVLVRDIIRAGEVATWVRDEAIADIAERLVSFVQEAKKEGGK
jgi:hypothetical protein